MEINATNVKAQYVKLMCIGKCFERLSAALTLAEKYLITSAARKERGIMTEEEAHWEMTYCKDEINSALQRLNSELDDVAMPQVSVDIHGIAEYWLKHQDK